jgi:hypothetical protein
VVGKEGEVQPPAASGRGTGTSLRCDDRERRPWVLEWPAIACWVGNILPRTGRSLFTISGRDDMPPERAGDDVVRTSLEDTVWRGDSRCHEMTVTLSILPGARS